MDNIDCFSLTAIFNLFRFLNGDEFTLDKTGYLIASKMDGYSFWPSFIRYLFQWNKYPKAFLLLNIINCIVWIFLLFELNRISWSIPLREDAWLIASKFVVQTTKVHLKHKNVIIIFLVLINCNLNIFNDLKSAFL